MHHSAGIEATRLCLSLHAHGACGDVLDDVVARDVFAVRQAGVSVPCSPLPIDVSKACSPPPIDVLKACCPPPIDVSKACLQQLVDALVISATVSPHPSCHFVEPACSLLVSLLQDVFEELTSPLSASSRQHSRQHSSCWLLAAAAAQARSLPLLDEPFFVLEARCGEWLHSRSSARSLPASTSSPLG